MGFEKYVNILERLHLMIKMRSTGTAKELAKKLGIGHSWLREYLDIMEVLGAEIGYDRHLKTYFYIREGEFDFHFRKKK